MGDGVLSPGVMAMDWEYMDQLLLEGCWLETTDGSEFLNPSPSNYLDRFGPSFSDLEIDDAPPDPSPSKDSNQEGQQLQPSLQEISQTNELQGRNLVDNQSLVQTATEESELNRRWWIGPGENSGTSVMEKLIRALGYIREYSKDKDVLVQLWVPVNRGGKRVLTTHDQPYALETSCRKLASYRDVSINYQFSAEEDSKDFLGLPGRVFLGKVPEWTPDVRFFRSDEYPRVDYAQQCDIRGTLALPVFEQDSRNCLGVIEVVMTTQKIKYRPELENVRKALEAVDLTSSEIPKMQNIKVTDLSYEAALPEILEVLTTACTTHQLPLAQTWVRCIQQGKEGCRHSDENYLHCVSTVDHACYVADPSVKGFQEACSEHHLLKGQGIVGQAFMTNQPCFSNDLTSLGKTDYPLSHHARMFELHAAVAIRLRSVHTGSVDYVLEFFLPVDCRDPEEHMKMLNSLSIIIQRVCRTLRIVTDEELQQETNAPTGEVSIQPRYAIDNSSNVKKVPQNENDVSLGEREKHKVSSSEEGCSLKGNIEQSGDPNSAEASFTSEHVGARGEKKRAKSEKAITLQVLRQYFAGSLKDAAKNLGVCPTTLKRICRQQGIQRWPSRKIKKVGHSLQKIQLVIDSVQGASGSLEIGSLCKNFPELTSPNVSKTTPPSETPNSSNIQHENNAPSSQATVPKSPSSTCSHSSSSMHSCSSGTQQHTSAFTIAANEYPTIGDESSHGNSLKRVRSDAELHMSSQEALKLPTRSRRHKSLIEEPNLGTCPPLPVNVTRVSNVAEALRVKVAYGNDKIRFRMDNKWTFKDLMRGIGRRFDINDMRRYELKYLDDDSDWVLLTCDDDLEECVDVSRSSHSRTIKLCLQLSSHLHDT